MTHSILYRLPVLDSIDYTSKSYLVHLTAEHGDTSLTIESEWLDLYTVLFNLYDINTLSSYWKQRCTESVPDVKADVVNGLVFVLNNERLVTSPPVRSEDSMTDT